MRWEEMESLVVRSNNLYLIRKWEHLQWATVNGADEEYFNNLWSELECAARQIVPEPDSQSDGGGRASAVPAASDGPTEKGMYRFQGRSARCQPLAWRILEYMEKRESAPIESVIAHVWRDGGAPTDNALRVALKKANQCLVAVGARWNYSQCDGQIIRT